MTVELAPRARLLDELVAAAAEHGVDSAQVELLGGTLGVVSYCVPAECRDGSTAVSYSRTRTADGPVIVTGGAVTLGRRDGKPFMHCHAAWIDVHGRVLAGHLWPATTVGPVPLHATLYPLHGVHSISADDPESRMPVFTPHRGRAPIPAAGRRAVMARVLPGENLRAAVDQACREAGFRRAVVRASIGSVVGPTLLRGDTTRVVGGPCTEVVSLLGEVGPDIAGDAPLHVLAVDADGAVHGGVIDPAASPVAVTAEVLILGEDHP